MSCTNPVTAFYSREINPNGKRSIQFRRDQRYAYQETVELPCNKCAGCIIQRKAEWAVRCYHEASQHQQNSFLTLTYDDDHLPPSIEQPVLSKFIRSVRDRGNKFRYYACGEYGERTRRPHYHMLVFGMDWLGGAEQITEDLYHNPILDALWGRGHCSVGAVTMGTCCYVAGYVAKKMGDADSFHVMSRRPGIGHDWLDKYHGDIASAGTVIIDGIKLPIPRRYLAWKETELVEVISERKKYYEEQTKAEKEERQNRRPHKEVNYRAKLNQRGSKI